jgi:hypothetical protein
VVAAVIAAMLSSMLVVVPAQATVAWHGAIEVPGLGSLNSGNDSVTQSISCSSAGNCSAVGYYSSSATTQQAFGVDESNGVWSNAFEIAGISALDVGGSSELQSISCSSAGNCVAGGWFTNAGIVVNSSLGPGASEAFVVNETDGVWTQAEGVSGTLSPGMADPAVITSISCSSPGNCSAGGWYTDSNDFQQAFVVDEIGRVWGSGTEVPGTATLNAGGNAQVNVISCSSPGNCAAGGFFAPENGTEAFVVDEADGTWGAAEEVAGSLDQDQDAEIATISCSSASNCVAGGEYGQILDNSPAEPSPDGQQAFIVSETNGTWNVAEEVPGTAALNKGYMAQITGISCSTNGNCTAGGIYYITESSLWSARAFVVTETNGVWANAQGVPGTTKNIFKESSNWLYAVSCSSAGNCSAGGFDTIAVKVVARGREEYYSSTAPYVVNETNGRWGNALAVFKTPAIDEVTSLGIDTISCSADGACGAGGAYDSVKNYNETANSEAFVVGGVN